MQIRIQAEEAKKQQEGFIDMTTHEIRNPLSAMQLCADGIVELITKFQASEGMGNQSVESVAQLLENNLDAAQTILLCAHHQKRIIDDVLTLSKLNATMLQVTPVDDQVENTIRQTLKMFHGELEAHKIGISFEIEDSYREAQIDWVLCDPARVKQVFINLLSNVSGTLLVCLVDISKLIFFRPSSLHVQRRDEILLLAWVLLPFRRQTVHCNQFNGFTQKSPIPIMILH